MTGGSSRRLPRLCLLHPQVFQVPSTAPPSTTRSLHLGGSLGETSQNMRGARCRSLFIHHGSNGTMGQDTTGCDPIGTSHRMAAFPVGGLACHTSARRGRSASHAYTHARTHTHMHTAQTANRRLPVSARQTRIVRCKRLWGQYDKSPSQSVTLHELFAGPAIRDEPSAARVRQGRSGGLLQPPWPSAARWGFRRPDHRPAGSRPTQGLAGSRH